MSDTSNPSSLNAAVYPNDPVPQFPEQTDDRYNPNKTPIGIALSGGGPRAFSCAHGQMAGLMDCFGGKMLDYVGAISCVSGGTWFGSLFSYADGSFSDTQLIGPVTKMAPGDLSPNLVEAEIPSDCLLSIMPNLSNSHVVEMLLALFAEHKLDPTWMPDDRFYSGLANVFFCIPFGIGDRGRSYTVDGELGAPGTSLPDIETYKLRQGRPFFIANGTQLYPSGMDLIMRRFEFTSLYTGLPQEYPGAGAGGADIGYGYLESFAFNSEAPQAAPSNGVVTVNTPALVNCLSDAVGSSSDAFGELLLALAPTVGPYINPSYAYWPMTNIGSQAAVKYEVTDGGSLEDTGIAALMVRGFPLIFAFVNTSLPLGSSSGACVDGVDGQISRLFGYNPKDTFGNTQDTQIFEASEFKSKLVPGLNAAKAAGGPVTYVDDFTVIEDNAFGIDAAAYPDGVGIAWIYNDLDSSWKNALSGDMQALLEQTDPCAFMLNFPNFKTVGQNTCDHIPEVVWFAPAQANLLANMWYNAVAGPGGETMIEVVKRRLAKLGF